jgi:hypothetical protein
VGIAVSVVVVSTLEGGLLAALAGLVAGGKFPKK